MDTWEFWIDVGGTFTDCIARTPNGTFVTHKLLSSGQIKGQITHDADVRTFFDTARRGDPTNFWPDYSIQFFDSNGRVLQQTKVAEFDQQTGRFTTTEPLVPSVSVGTNYELSSQEEAPLVAIRYLMQLPLKNDVPPVRVKLGTTRGTNALLTRNGARTAFVTTAGFKDVLRIGNQNRPRLFDLAIQKPTELFETVLEVDERIDADGSVLITLNEQRTLDRLKTLYETGIESIAICLLHSYKNDTHEKRVERLAREAGFTEVSQSSQIAPIIKIVSRGDTTVVDAYLNPILRSYIQQLRGVLKKSELKIMTSAGGVVDAAHFLGKDSILSGPAGGVVGFSQVAKQAGFPKSIGFDMGGTSTDVSRFDGEFEYEFETVKAGARVVAPMLAIETVAAGGGSICQFDGVKLAVGPQSAGADPGPACYGRGGPLTVTDMNFYLGKLLPQHFPFQLDIQSVERQLSQLCEEIQNSPLGKKYTPVDLAEGFLEIANTNMVRAIRKISVAKGFNPAEYALVSFGGAGAQHACAIARLLGSSHILIHPYAGILSAYGIGLADVRRFAERSVLKPYNDQCLEHLEATFVEMEKQARSEVLTAGVNENQIGPGQRSLEIRYLGTEATLYIPCPVDGDYRQRFEDLHLRQFGYNHSGRELEITTARVEVVGRMKKPATPERPFHRRKAEPTEFTKTHFNDAWQSTPVFQRANLSPGDEFDGPAIICDSTSTIIVDPGFHAHVTKRSDIQIEPEETRTGNSDLQFQPSRGGFNDTPDPVLLEVFNNLFSSIAEQMGITLQQTAFSTNVKERMDFSCAIFSSDGDLVVNAPHIPVHLGAMSDTVKHILADNPQMSPGDVFVTNDPYRGGSHLPDVTTVTPVHDENTKQLLFLTASRAHHAEIGGIIPGSMPPFSAHLAEEGVLIRQFKLVDAGVSHDAEFKKLLESGTYPSRSVNDNLADVSAQVAANNHGVKLLQDLVERYSLPIVQAYMVHIQQAATEKMKQALKEIPDGMYRRTEHLDDGTPIQVTIEIKGEVARVDFSGTGPVLPSNLNANRAIVSAAVLYVFRCLIQHDIPLNSGVLAPIEIILPECLLNPPEQGDPRDCAAMVGGNVETSQRVVDVLLGALGMAAASQGTMNNLTFGNNNFGYYETICGGSGATPDANGADAVHTHMTNTRLTDPEVIERRYPVRVLNFSIRKNSGGRGFTSGGNGVVRQLQFLEPLTVSMLSERRGKYAPYGLNGGSPGNIGHNFLKRAGEDQDADLGGKFSIEVAADDIITIETPGGGGFGAPENK